MPSPPNIPTGVHAPPLDYVIYSPLMMWLWNQYANKWEADSIQKTIEDSMRAYILFWEKTGWRLIELKHVASEDWLAILKRSMGTGLLSNVMCSGKGSTAAIAICEAIKAASLADAEVPKRDAESSAIL